MFHPFGEQDRVDVRLAEYDGGLDHLREEVRTRRYDWDAIDLEEADAVKACTEGLLHRIEPQSLRAGDNGIPAARDFAPNAIGPCWVGSVVFAQVIVYAPHHLAQTPRTARDFFDVTRFPGGRGMRGDAKLNLELALLAEGVAPKDVYPILSTAPGVERALQKLSTIRSSIVWWSRPGEAVEMLADGRAVMTTALNGDVFDAQIRGAPVRTIWDRQLDELDVFAVPAGDSKANLALDFIRYATGTRPLARVAEWVPYGPARQSALPFVQRNPDLRVAMLPYLPTAPANRATAFVVDDAWWMRHGAAIAPVWRAWRDEGG
jgi:putative spermidine/putrescine transport system substrate-binding protein